MLFINVETMPRISWAKKNQLIWEIQQQYRTLITIILQAESASRVCICHTPIFKNEQNHFFMRLPQRNSPWPWVFFFQCIHCYATFQIDFRGSNHSCITNDTQLIVQPIYHSSSSCYYYYYYYYYYCSVIFSFFSDIRWVIMKVYWLTWDEPYH